MASRGASGMPPAESDRALTRLIAARPAVQPGAAGSRCVRQRTDCNWAGA